MGPSQHLQTGTIAAIIFAVGKRASAVAAGGFGIAAAAARAGEPAAGLAGAAAGFTPSCVFWMVLLAGEDPDGRC
jgi:hypothetical protein